MQSLTLLPRTKKSNDTEFKFRRMQEGYIGNTIAPVAMACRPCFACVPIRTNISDFFLTKSQRKLVQSSPLTYQLIETSMADFEALYSTYRRYVNARHKGSQMDKWPFATFKNWLKANPLVLVAYDQNKVVGFSSLDMHEKELSLDYSAFDPNYSKLSIGKNLWLQTMAIAQKAGIEYVYVGPWAADSPKLDYKKNFRGLEAFQNGGWIPFESQIHIEGPDYKRMLTIAGHPNLG